MEQQETQMEDRRKHSSVKDHDMDDLKSRLIRIEQQGVDAQIATKVMENSFDNHIDQNVKDFKHVDDCIHRSDDESRGRDHDLAKVVDKMSEDLMELKKFMWKTGGALLILVPLVNHVVGKYL